MKDRNFDEITAFIVEAILSDSYFDKTTLEIKIRTALRLYGKKVEDSLPNLEIWKFRAMFWRDLVKHKTPDREDMRRHHAKLTLMEQERNLTEI